MTRIAVLSLKGGTGKTSVTLGLAGAAATAGRAVVVVDLDPQANASAGLGIIAAPLTIGDALADGRRGIARDALYQSAWPSPAFDPVQVVPADRSLEHRSASEPGSSGRLSRVLDGVGPDGALVLIDCPPSLGELTLNALVAADAALIVTDPTYFALTGAEQAVEAIDVVRGTSNVRLRNLGMVINRVRARSADQTFRLRELRAAYPELVLDPPLADRVCVPASQGAGIPLQSWPGAGARSMSEDLRSLLESITSRVGDHR